ncbi:MAG: HlyD family efflux transporter periplasmic adaptor subunit [Gammaproteobacteria bacterium]|nr:HlyD family efflux transporter periplasmic adaptor subunit [Gammaproteobacteria bacterium]
MKKKLILPLLILVIGIGGLVLLIKIKTHDKPVKTEEKAWTVSAISVTPQNLSPTLTLYGRAESPRAATLSAALTADVAEVAVLEGIRINKDRLLVRLDDRNSRFVLQQREAELQEIDALLLSEKNKHAGNLVALPREKALLAFIRKAVERAQRLKKQKAASQSALDEASQTVERQRLVLDARRFEIKNHTARLAQLQARRARAAALHNAARLDLNRTRINAPFAGVVTKVFVAPGDRVRSGEALLSLYDKQTLEIRAQIPNRHQYTVIEALAAGQALRARVLREQPVFLLLDRLSGQVNQGSGGIDGLFRINEGRDLLHLGQFVSLSLQLPALPGVISLPFEAVYGEDRVYKLHGERMAAVKIERIGELQTPAGKTRILARIPDLQAGEQIISTRLPNAMHGLKVDPEL